MTRKEVYITVGAAAVCAVLAAPLGELGLRFLGWLADGIARASTFGIRALIDAQYATAATSLGEPTGVRVAASAVAGVVLLTGTFVLNVLAHATLQFESSAGSFVGVRRVLQNGALASLAATFVFLTLAAQASYAGKLAHAYTRREVLAAPYLTDLEIKRARAEFVLIGTREGYEKLMASLEAAVRARGGRLE